jgi:hypothetical protein
MVNEKTDYKFFKFIKVHFYVLEENKTKATCSRQKMVTKLSFPDSVWVSDDETGGLSGVGVWLG